MLSMFFMIKAAHTPNGVSFSLSHIKRTERTKRNEISLYVLFFLGIEILSSSLFLIFYIIRSCDDLIM